MGRRWDQAVEKAGVLQGPGVKNRMSEMIYKTANGAGSEKDAWVREEEGGGAGATGPRTLGGWASGNEEGGVERLGGRRGRGREPGTGRENSVGEGVCESPSSEPGVGLGEQ